MSKNPHIDYAKIDLQRYNELRDFYTTIVEKGEPVLFTNNRGYKSEIYGDINKITEELVLANEALKERFDDLKQSRSEANDRVSELRAEKTRAEKESRANQELFLSTSDRLDKYKSATYIFALVSVALLLVIFII